MASQCHRPNRPTATVLKAGKPVNLSHDHDELDRHMPKFMLVLGLEGLWQIVLK